MNTNQMKEAVRRLDHLYGKNFPNVVNEFKNEGVINLTENGGFLYWLDDDQMKIVEEFEKKTGAIVYTAISQTLVLEEYGYQFETLSLLYVSEYPDEWKADWRDLQKGELYANVYNVETPIFSEIGLIGIKINPLTGGLVRTY